MGILDSKKELAAMQEEIEQLRADVDRLKNLVLAISKQVPAPTDPQPSQDFVAAGSTTFVFEKGADSFNKFFKK